MWTAGFLAFPLAGLAGTAVGGRVDSPLAALSGGLACGLVIGPAQALTSRGRLDPHWWIPASALGMGVGLLLGAAVVGYRTSLTALVVMGALTGLTLGIAQTVALPSRTSLRWTWALAMPVLWALGWAVTTLGQIDVEQQFTNFGAYGAVTFSALSGVLLHYLLPYRESVDARQARTRVEAPS